MYMNLTMHDVRDLALKLFGFYCLVRFVVIVPQIISLLAYASENEQFLTSRTLLAVISYIPAIFYLVLAFFLLFRTRTVLTLLWGSEKEEEPGEAGADFRGTCLAFWIVLIGIYYFIQSASGVATELWVIAVRKEMIATSFVSIKFLPNLVILPLSLVCMFKARSIERFIVNRSAGEAVDRSD
jgi:hypothetical protein